jgi:hypothetical protein
MKKLGLVFVLLCGGVFWAEAFGQTARIEELYLPKEDGKIIYQKVLDLKGVQAKEIFKRANFWFIDSFKIPNDVINYNNPEEGIIIGKGNLNLTWVNEKAVLVTPITVLLSFSVKLEVKEEKLRYSIFDLAISDLTLRNFRAIETEFTQEKMYSKKGKPDKYSWDWYYIYEDAVRSLENSIEKGVNKSESKDW